MLSKKKKKKHYKIYIVYKINFVKIFATLI